MICLCFRGISNPGLPCKPFCNKIHAFPLPLKRIPIHSHACVHCLPLLSHLYPISFPLTTPCFSGFSVSSSLLLCSLVVSRHSQPQKLCPQDVPSLLCSLSLFPHIAEFFKSNHHFRFPKVHVRMSVARDQMQPPAPFLLLTSSSL